jgi:hypothetical protein
VAKPALTRGDLIRFIYGAGDTEYTDITRPIWGYEATINLPWEISRQDDNTYDIFDNGPDGVLDTRQCVCDFMLTATEQTALIDVLTSDSKGRAAQITLQTIANSGFFLFGPDLGDSGPWDVSCEILDAGGIGPGPWKHFRPKLKFTLQGSSPAYSFPADESTYHGPLTIGSVSNVRFPEMWFQPVSDYGIITTILNGKGARYLTTGEDGDGFTTGFELNMRIAKACRVIDYLVHTGRAYAVTSMTLASPTDSHPFGISRGSGGSYNVKFIQDQITIRHSAYNQFFVKLSFAYISGPS